MAGLIYGSLKSQESILVYFGFIRGTITKSLFKIFCACLIFPGSSGTLENGPTGIYSLSFGYAIFLNLVALV